MLIIIYFRTRSYVLSDRKRNHSEVSFIIVMPNSSPMNNIIIKNAHINHRYTSNLSSQKI